jgi:hypothetical protein
LRTRRHLCCVLLATVSLSEDKARLALRFGEGPLGARALGGVGSRRRDGFQGIAFARAQRRVRGLLCGSEHEVRRQLAVWLLSAGLLGAFGGVRAIGG